MEQKDILAYILGRLESLKPLGAVLALETHFLMRGLKPQRKWAGLFAEYNNDNTERTRRGKVIPSCWRAKNLNLRRVYVTEVEVVVDTKTFPEGSMGGPAILLNMGPPRQGCLRTREAKLVQVLRGMIDMLGKNGVYQFPFPSHFISCKSLFFFSYSIGHIPFEYLSEESQPENLDKVRCRTWFFASEGKACEVWSSGWIGKKEQPEKILEVTVELWKTAQVTSFHGQTRSWFFPIEMLSPGGQK